MSDANEANNTTQPADAPKDEERAAEQAALPVVTIRSEEVDAAAADAEAPKRRVRRTYSVDTPALGEPDDPSEAGETAADPASAGDAAPGRSTPAAPSDKPAGRRDRPARQPRRDGRGPRPRRDDKASAIQGVRRTKVYRQDFEADAPPPAPPSKPEAKQVHNQQDKITLLLHPAPKASIGKRNKAKDRPKTAKEAITSKVRDKDKPRSDGASSKQDVSLNDAWLKANDDAAVDALIEAAHGGEALVKAWLDAGNVNAITKAAHASRVTGKSRKAARRALNVLKSRGIAVAKPQPVTPTEHEAEPVVAKFIPPDATGTTFFSISQRQSGGRYNVADVIFRPAVGVVHSQAARLAGKHIREWQNRIEKQYGTKPVDVPLDWARHQIALARKTNDQSGQLVPLGFDSCAALLQPVPDLAPPHPLDDLQANEPTPEALSEATSGSDILHNEPEFRGWLPDKPAIDEMLRKVGERVGAEGAKDPKLVDDALGEEVTAATDRFFSPELREEIANRMRLAAISVRARSGDDLARRVLFVAKAVTNAGLITSPPSEIPFLVTFFQKAVAMMVRQGQGQLRVPVPRVDPA
jgi:hypothetical protein